MPDQSSEDEKKTVRVQWTDGSISGTGADSNQSNAGALADNTVDTLRTSLAGGKYQIIEELGRGGMSVVYAAIDNSLGRKVAVKVLLAEYAATAGKEALSRFQQEARAVAKLSHAHIVSIHEYGLLEEGSPFIVMDYINGLSLADLVAEKGLMAPERVFEILKQSAEALRHSHGQNVIHRDIKPSNIILTRGDGGEDFVAVVDFGIAKMQDVDNSGKLTRTGQVFGSPLYMSPEQCEGQIADTCSDIYSLGCVAYELITGRAPHAGKNAIETMHRKMTSEPVPYMVQAVTAGKGKLKKDPDNLVFKHALQNIIIKMLARDPGQRQQSAAQLLAELEQIRPLLRADEKSPVHPSLKAPPPAGKIWAIAGGGTVLIALAATLMLSHPQPPAASVSIKPVTVKPVDQESSRSAPALVNDENSADTALLHWQEASRAGQNTLSYGWLEKAQTLLYQAIRVCGSIHGELAALSEDVSLSDAIDLQQVKGSATFDPGLWQRYQNMVVARRQTIYATDKTLIDGLDQQLLIAGDDNKQDPQLLDQLLKATMKRANEELDDERYGDLERLLKHAVPVLEKAENKNGMLARANHILANVKACENNWTEALTYADKAASFSHGNEAVHQTNLALALIYRGWAQVEMKADPGESFAQAIEIARQGGPSFAPILVSALRRAAKYAVQNGDQDQAFKFAREGLSVAQDPENFKGSEARRQVFLADFYDILGDRDQAIKSIQKGLDLEEIALPRQDFKVMEDLRTLATYLKQNGQELMSEAVRHRVKAMYTRLTDFDKIFAESNP